MLLNKHKRIDNIFSTFDKNFLINLINKYVKNICLSLFLVFILLNRFTAHVISTYSNQFIASIARIRMLTNNDQNQRNDSVLHPCDNSYELMVSYN